MMYIFSKLTINLIFKNQKTHWKLLLSFTILKVENHNNNFLKMKKMIFKHNNIMKYLVFLKNVQYFKNNHRLSGHLEGLNVLIFITFAPLNRMKNYLFILCFFKLVLFNIIIIMMKMINKFQYFLALICISFLKIEFEFECNSNEIWIPLDVFEFRLNYLQMLFNITIFLIFSS